MGIFSTPYAPSLWLGRGATFLKLGYPELALGDLYKAKILVEEALRHDSPVGAAAFLMVGRSVTLGGYGEVGLQEDSTDAVGAEQAADFSSEKTTACISPPFKPQTGEGITQVADCEGGSSCLSTDGSSFVLDEAAPLPAQDEDTGSATTDDYTDQGGDEAGTVNLQIIGSNKGFSVSNIPFDASPTVDKTEVTEMELALNAVKQIEHSVLQSLITGLRAAGAVGQALKVCKESRSKHPDAVVYKLLEIDIRSCMTEHELNSPSYYGDIHRRVYPWMTKDLLQRNEKTLAMIQKEFTGVGATTEVKQSKFLNSLFLKDSPPDLYGVHAIRNIPVNTVVFFDSSLFFATTAPGRCPTCAERLPLEDSQHKCGGCSRAFCNETCWWRAAVEMHDPLCGRDFSYLYSAAEKAAKDPDSSPCSALEPLLLLRVLATIFQPNMMHMLLELQSALPDQMAHVVEANSKTWTPTNPTDHPLTQPIVARLTANYYSDTLVSFSYEDQIVNPTRILQTLGIDIFANHAYDTWVLEAIRHRICNNRLGATLPGRDGKEPHRLLALHPCYAMLNHSCEPNCGVAAGVSGGPGLMGTDGKIQPGKDSDGEGAGIVIISTKKIKKGRELFISYIADIETMPREERQRRLSVWFGEEGCKCGRCEREKVVI